MADASPSIVYPLREKRRLENRQAFIESAGDLFVSRGFSRTTMEDIAGRAGLHVQTLYRHFPTKHAVFTAIGIETFRNAIDARESDTLDFWRRHVEQSANAVIEQDGGAQFLQYVRNVRHDPKLTAARAEIRIECTELLADGIRADFELSGLNGHLPILIANMLWGGNADAVRRWSEGRGEDLIAVAVDMADTVTAMARDQLGLKLKAR